MVVPPVPEQASALSSVLDVVDKVTKILALLIGGGWAYLNYVRGRTFNKRLELKISGKRAQKKGVTLLSGTAQIKNVGLSKFPIEQKGTAILFFDLKPSASVKRLAETAEERVGVREVFKDHAWIEPGETIEDNFLVQLPEDEERLAVKLDLRVVAAHIEWNANCIVELETDIVALDAVDLLPHGQGWREKWSTKIPGLTDMVVQLIERPEVTDDIEREKQKPREKKPAIDRDTGTEGKFTEM
jgi:hypothetical protein